MIIEPANRDDAPRNVPRDDASHVLVVDDDQRIRELLKRYLSEHEYRVTTAQDAATARTRIASLEFDIIVLDVMMPGESGLELAHWLRANSDIPILMLSARGEPDDRIAGLEIGVDDYLPKPFEPKELLLRMENALRRWKSQTRTEITIGDCLFDIDRGELRRDGEPVKLTSRERDMLRLFARAPGHTIARTALAQTGGGSVRSVDVQVNRLRQKIEPDPRHPIYLQTVRGEGYALMGH
ncbi:MAG: response regulator transcription factor [Rhizobiales bacterium]|nr:response regulator transcription factor [Hyphomicrobiales bacterium]